MLDSEWRSVTARVPSEVAAMARAAVDYQWDLLGAMWDLAEAKASGVTLGMWWMYVYSDGFVPGPLQRDWIQVRDD